MKIKIPILLAAIFSIALAEAQEKIKIVIKKNINGTETTIERDIDPMNKDELNSLLQEEGIEFDFDVDGTDNRIIEIYIDKAEADQKYAYSMDSCHEPKAFLGVSPGEKGTEQGVLIGHVTEGSAAEKAGLKEGDLIQEVAGKKTLEFSDLKDAMAAQKPGDEVKVKYTRDGKKMSANALLGESRPEHHRSFMNDEDFHFEFDADDHEKMQKRIMKFEKEHGNMEDQERVYEWFEEDMGEEKNAFEFDHRRNGSQTVVVIMEKISPEEATKVNAQASPKLSTANDLKIDNIRFFPNPGDGRFELSFSAPEKGDLEVLIYDMQGKKVYYEMLADFDGAYMNSIDISRRDAGNYFIQISQNGKTYSRKLIKE